MCDTSSVRNWLDQLQLKCRLPCTYRYPCLQQAEQKKKIHQGYEVRCFSLLKQHHVTVQDVHAFHSFPLSSSSTRHSNHGPSAPDTPTLHVLRSLAQGGPPKKRPTPSLLSVCRPLLVARFLLVNMDFGVILHVCYNVDFNLV